MHCERALALAEAPSALDRERTLKRWVADYVGFVARVLRGAGTPAAEVDDAVQRTFIIAARKQADVRVGSERSFLLQTALNVAAHARRSAARRREVPASELPELVDAATPEQLTSSKRDRLLLERVLSQLSPELRNVFVLSEVEELTRDQIAATLEIPAGTVASRLRRAREQLRERWRLERGAAAATLGVAAWLLSASARAAEATLARLGLPKLLLGAAVVATAPIVYLQLQPGAAPVARVELAAVAPSLQPARQAAVLPVAPAFRATESVSPVNATAAAFVAPSPQAVPLPTSRSNKPASAAALQLELAQLDAARARLAAGGADDALALLAAYDRSSPRGVLGLEAEVLRIDALSRSGRGAQARARAQAFLARHPTSVLAARVRRIVAE
jgi:RNA polymerase sigma-70 factor, ECF subfamily